MKKYILICMMMAVATLLVNSCLDPFNPKTSTSNLNYLVVEGILNSNGDTRIQLGRTTPISTTTLPVGEAGAQVFIEGDDGSIYGLSDAAGVGMYSASTAGLDVTRLYRLRIKTADQKEYVSDFVPVKDSPDIDTITYKVTGEDFKLYISTHDASNKTHYYSWRYVETWAYNSRYPSDYEFVDRQMVLRPNPYIFYNCWNTANSNQILLASSEKLAQDIISDFPLISLNVHSEKFQTKYSVLIEQFALTQEAYEYREQLKKSTESVGSIFDPQPSQSETNIHSVNNAHEPVVGYFSAGAPKMKRIFISTDDLPEVIHTTGYEDCILDTLRVQYLDLFEGQEAVVAAVSDMRGQIIYYLLSTFQCVDCRKKGGTTEEPDFWQ